MKIVCMNNDFDEYDSYESISAYKVNDNYSFEGLLPYAREGNAYAQYFLSELYKKGVDVIANEERAAFWAKKAKNGFLKCAKEGNVLAQYYTALLYADDGKYSEAAEWYLMVARIGDVTTAKYIVKSRYALALMYKDGNGVKRDVTKSFEWCKKAAEGYKDENQCQFREAWDMLGDFYASGVGTKQDFVAAVEAYEKAGKTEKAVLYYRLAANCIMDQVNAKSNDYSYREQKEKAFSYYKIAAERGDVEALESLLKLEDAKDYRGTERISEILFEHGEIDEDALLDLYRTHGNRTKVAEILEKRAENGTAEDKWNLGVKYASGNDIYRDMNKALYWHEKAAESEENADWLLKLGNWFNDGEYYFDDDDYRYGEYSIERDAEKALLYLEKAVSLGATEADGKLFDLYKELGKTDKIAEILEKRAENGTAEDKWNLGLKYATGEVVAKDEAKAAEFLGALRVLEMRIGSGSLASGI